MSSELVKLGKHSIVYGLGSAVMAVGGFLLIPLYTSVFPPAEYGVLELINQAINVLMLLMVMGTRQAYIRFYFDHEDADWQKQVTNSALLFIIVSCVIFSLVALPFVEYFAEIFFKTSQYNIILYLAMLWVPFELLNGIGLASLQIQLKSTLYVALGVLRLILFLGSNVILLLFLDIGLKGVICSHIFATGMITLGFLAYFIRWSNFKISFKIITEMLKYGLPYLPASFFAYIMLDSDKYILGMTSSLNQLGLYALGYKIGMMGTTLLMGPFSKVWGPFVFGNYKKENGATLISQALTLFILASATGALAVSMVAPILIPLISPQEYHSAAVVVPLVCIGSLFYSLACLVDAGILIAKKTKLKPLLFGICAVVSILLNIILIPRYGAIGASLALTGAFGLLLFLNFRISNMYFYIKLETRRIMVILGSTLATYYLFYLIFPLTEGSQLLNISSILTFILYPLLLWAGGFLNPKEREFVKGLFAAQGR